MFIIDYKINKCLHSVRDYITSEFLTYLSDYGNNITQNKRDLAKKSVSCLLLNLYTKHTTSSELKVSIDKVSVMWSDQEGEYYIYVDGKWCGYHDLDRLHP